MSTQRIKNKITEAIQTVAVENWADQNISTEGISDVFTSIKDTFKKWRENSIRKRQKPDPMRIKNVEMSWWWIIREIKKTYLNSIWLSGRTQVTMDISASYLPQMTYEGNYIDFDADHVSVALGEITKIGTQMVAARATYIDSFENHILDKMANGQFDDSFGKIDIRRLSFALEAFFKAHGTVSDLMKRIGGSTRILLPHNKILSFNDRGIQITDAKTKLKVPTLVNPLGIERIPHVAENIIATINKVPGYLKVASDMTINVVDDYVVELDDDETDGRSDQLVAVTSGELKRALMATRNSDALILIDDVSWNMHYYIPLADVFDLVVGCLIATEKHMSNSIS